MGDAKQTATAESLSLPHLIKWAEMAVRARVERAIGDLPVSSSQLFALALLDELGEITAATLARRMHLTPQAMTTLLGPMRTQGLIGRREDGDHGRRLLLSLTEAGREVLERAHALNPAIEADVLSPLPPGDRVTLARLLAAIARPSG